MSGEANAAMSTIYEVIQLQSMGHNVKIVALLDYTTGADMVLSHDKFENLYDLNGKTIGVEKGSISHYTLLQALHKAGLTQSDVRFEFKTMSELITLFKEKN